MVKSKEKKLKAYYCEEEATGYGFIEWFETVGQARAHFANEFQVRFTDVHPIRMPWADQYGNMDAIPVEVLFKNDWCLECDTCGGSISEMEDFFENERGYCCKSCFEKER